MKPNLLFIICDDLTWGDLSLHGNPYLHTAHLDALGRDSVQLTRYCSGPLCTPARAALMTGRHPYRTGAHETYISRSMLHHDEVTLPELLRSAGYATGLFGKWHLGDCYPMRPCDKGFDESLWHRGGGLRQYANVDHFEGRDGYFDPLLHHQGELVESRGYCTDIFTDAALQWIRQREVDQPWFAYVAYNAPHTPVEIGEEWVAPFRQTKLPELWQKLYGMIANLDQNVGRLLALLEELNQRENTLVVFTSDHGVCPSSMVDGQPRFNAGLRGWKGSMYEGSLKVPCLVRWPERLPAGELAALSNPIDWLPTFAAVCGFKLPAQRVIDGINLLPVLERTAPPPQREIVMQFNRAEYPRRFVNAAVLTERWKWYRLDPLQPPQLYDLVADPGETHDLAEQHPDLVAQFSASYERWFEAMAEERADNYNPPRIVVGHPHAPTTYLTLQDGRLLGTHEGWGTTFPCQWLVEVHQAGRYRFEIHLGNSPPGRTWHLRAGSSWASFTIPTTRFTYDLNLHAGKQSISCLSYGACDDLYPNQPDPGVRTVGQIAVTRMQP